MVTPLLPQWENIHFPVIGMLHLKALPGSPQYDGNRELIKLRLLQDAECLVDGGVHGLLIENFGDRPYFPRCVPISIVSHMTILAAEIRQRWPDIPLGINVLRNDGCAAITIAHAVNAQFIRVNVLCHARLTDQGIIDGIAHKLHRQRAMLDAKNIRILADIRVKHSSPLTPLSLEEETANTIQRGLADAVIISGAATGQAIDKDDLEKTRSASGSTPLVIGSGIDIDSIISLSQLANGAIVGTAVKKNGQPANPVDQERVNALIAALTSSK